MKLQIEGRPVNVGFNFSASSSKIAGKIIELLSEGKMFALYTEDKRTFKIYNPSQMVSIDSDKEIINYQTIDQFNAAIGFDVMFYDLVEDLHSDNLINKTKLLKS